MKKKLIYKQRDLTDCGVCCLASIISYYNGYYDLEYLRDLCFTDKSGTTAFNLINGAKAIGFDAVGLKIEDICEVDCPFIAHVTLSNGLDHYIVVYEYNNKYVMVMDPAVGKKRMNINEFNDIWNKIAICLSPIDNISVYKRENIIWNVLKRIFIENKLLLISIIICNLIFTLIVFILNYNYQITLSVIASNSKDMLMNILILFLLFTGLKILFTYLKEYYTNYLSVKIDSCMYKKVIEKTFYLPLKVAKNRTVGEISTRFNEIGIIKSLVVDIFLILGLDLVMAFLSCILLIFISKELFLILVSGLLIFIAFNLLINKKLYRVVLQTINNQTYLNESVVEILNNFESIKNLNKESFFKREVLSNSDNYLSVEYRLYNFIRYSNLFKNLILELTIFFINSYAFLQIIDGKFEFISLVTFNAFMVYLFDPIRETIDMFPKFNYLKGCYLKINDYLKTAKEDLNKIVDHDFKFNLSFDNIKLSKNSRLILNDINFKINKGDRVSIIGKSGSGKSSICKLIMKHEEKTEGTIKLNNINYDDLSLDYIRNNIVYISQEEKLFNRSILDNLLLGEQIPIEEVYKVIDICNLSSFIESKPHRLHTRILKEGGNISGGERQRLILARALLRNKEVIILDEALSEVSLEMEENIINNMFDNYQKTIIIISHKKIKNKFDKVIKVGGDYE